MRDTLRASSFCIVMPAYLSSRLSSLDGDDGDERASPFLRCHPGLVPGSPSRITIPSYCLLLFPAGIFGGFENLVGVLDAVGGGRLRVFKSVINTEFLVLAESECVVGEDFDALDVA